MRAVIVLMILTILPLPGVNLTSTSSVSHGSSYIMVGGQNGTWYGPGQAPRLYQIFLSNNSATQLTPVHSEGTVWTGAWNGSQWLISGWGTNPGPKASNPYLYLYDGQQQINGGTLNQYDAEASWHGGDVFAASYNGKYWLLSGLGSDALFNVSTNPNASPNHMSLATFDGAKFTDLSPILPRQQDAILYTNAWNGTQWLIGGGYRKSGVLLAYSGSEFIDLTDWLHAAVSTFGSIQSIAWNGHYWLIGGTGFLAKYDGHSFLDLTSELNSTGPGGDFSHIVVNAIAWNGSTWLIGGGSPVALETEDQAWAALYGSHGFIDVSTSLRKAVFSKLYEPWLPETRSSILSICDSGGSWVIGGYSGSHGILLTYNNGAFVNISNLINATMSYVTWVDAPIANFTPVPEFQTILPILALAILMFITIRRVRKSKNW